MSQKQEDARRVVITGGSSGIGQATAELFARRGDRVVILDLSEPPPIVGTDPWVRVDVADASSVEAAFALVEDRMGGIDVAIANAGISRRRPALEIDAKSWRDVLDTNLGGVFWTWQAAARSMLRSERGGVLLATASTNASIGHRFYADYNASKAGVLALTRTFALELSPTIRANAVSPGYVLTAMQRREYDDAMLADVNSRLPAGRHAAPEEVAELFYFLASDAARYITGQELVIDGGETAGGIASTFGRSGQPLPT
jgi:3-oxoacyl-[acyl-carrier protein] reductase